MKPRFTTGELARLHGISKQTLIFYDRAGVFSPRERDDRNGYRYYTADQLEMLDHILILKDMGMSLEEIRAFLALPDTGVAVAELKRQRKALQERQAQIKEAMARLDHKILALETMADAVPGRITLEELPAAPLAVWPVQAPGGVVETDLALKLLLRTLHERRLPFVYEMGTRIAPESLQKKQWLKAFAVYFPLRRPAGGSLCVMRPGGTYLRCIHQGPYETVGETYTAMLERIKAQGLRLTGGSYERCIWDSMTARDPAAYRTELLLPVEASPYPRAARTSGKERTGG